MLLASIKDLINLLYIFLLRFREIRIGVLIIFSQMFMSHPNPWEESVHVKQVLTITFLGWKAYL